MRLLFVLAAFVACSMAIDLPGIDLPLLGIDLPLPGKIPKLDIPKLKDINPGKIVDMFGKFKGNFGKKYKNDVEHAKAMSKFGENLKRIAGLNERQAKKGGAKFGMNKFADLTDDEFTQQILMKEPAEPQSFADYERSNDTYVRRNTFQADSLDWRKTPFAVGPIRDQSSCGCCWAFTAASVIQSVYGIKNKKKIQPSEQQLCDCGMMDPKTPGCNGGSAAKGLQYAVKTGVSLESAYTAYTPSRATKANVCADKSKPNTIKIKSATQIYPADDYEMADALTTYGPLAAAFKVGSSFRFYESGIFYDDDCDYPETYLGGHAISVVGYETEDDVPYWIVKNSWGPDWGEDGFFRFARGYDLCTMESRRVVYAVPL